VRRALGIRRWHVLGHSWGGTIALEYGARRPPELAGLVLASPLVSAKSWIADADALRGRLPADVQTVLKTCDPPNPVTAACSEATNLFYRNFNGRYPAPDGMIDYSHRMGLSLNRTLYETMWGPSEFVATGSLRNYDGEPLLAKLDGRHTLWIVGQYDEARPVTAAAFAERVPGSELAVVPGGAHGFMVDRPDESFGILRPWLREQDRA
jgi:proline iminopeptidase/L-proline amide hydrolase